MNQVLSVTLQSLYELCQAERARRWQLHELTGLPPSHFKPPAIDGLPNLDLTVDAVIAGQPAHLTGYIGFGRHKVRELHLTWPDWVTPEQRQNWLRECGIVMRDMALDRLSDDDERIDQDRQDYRESLERSLS